LDKQSLLVILLCISRNYSIYIAVLVDKYDFICYVIYCEWDKSETAVEEVLHNNSELT